MKPGYRNESVVARIASEERIPGTVAERCFRGALQFLAIAAPSKEPLVPWLPVDRAWHTCILHTTDYTDSCEKTFGRYIHHQSTQAGRDGSHVTSYRKAY